MPIISHKNKTKLYGVLIAFIQFIIVIIVSRSDDNNFPNRTTYTYTAWSSLSHNSFVKHKKNEKKKNET